MYIYEYDFQVLLKINKIDAMIFKHKNMIKCWYKQLFSLHSCERIRIPNLFIFKIKKIYHIN